MQAEDPQLSSYDCIILDEFHERTMEVDLIVALLTKNPPKYFIVMSATIDGERLATYLNGIHIQAEGRAYPVDIVYSGGLSELPSATNLESRVRNAVESAPSDGDILVFAPGKAEINTIVAALKGMPFETLPLHGGLKLEQQAKVFRTAERRRVIVSTNVAETSLTVPSIRTVIDTGLVRRTRYHQGRGFLTLMPLAADSAEQRTGRAGRVAHGHCIRLWGKGARLPVRTPPEIQRESVVPLLLGALACGVQPEDLSFVDQPPSHALDTARIELEALGAIKDGQLTPRGHQLFRLPLRPELGRLIIEALGTPTAVEIVDLVAALEVSRPLFTGRSETPEDDLRNCGCDGTALVTALRQGDPTIHGLSRHVLDDMRRQARRLRNLFGLPQDIKGEVPAGLTKTLAQTVLKADQRSAYIKRTRKRHIAWSNGGTEIQITKHSAIQEEGTEAVVLLGLRSHGIDQRKTQLIATYAIPVTKKVLVEAGLGSPKLGPVSIENGRPIGTTEIVYAGSILTTLVSPLNGQFLQAALAALTLENRLFKGVAAKAIRKLREHELVQNLVRNGVLPKHATTALSPALPLDTGPKAWLEARFRQLGVEEPDDMDLIESSDLLPEDVSSAAKQLLDTKWPLTVDLGDSSYDVHYDFGKRIVTLERTKGDRKELPALHYLPSFRGFGIDVLFRGKRRVLRQR
jgi:hypothetical protein